MAQNYAHTPWLDDEVHEAAGRLTVILDIGVKDALIVLRDLARRAQMSLIEAAEAVNDRGLEALLALAEDRAGKPRRVTGRFLPRLEQDNEAASRFGLRQS
jgi:hypothetical protein